MPLFAGFRSRLSEKKARAVQAEMDRRRPQYRHEWQENHGVPQKRFHRRVVRNTEHYVLGANANPIISTSSMFESPTSSAGLKQAQVRGRFLHGHTAATCTGGTYARPYKNSYGKTRFWCNAITYSDYDRASLPESFWKHKLKVGAERALQKKQKKKKPHRRALNVLSSLK
jgi:hypothetical protein